MEGGISNLFLLFDSFPCSFPFHFIDNARNNYREENRTTSDVVFVLMVYVRSLSFFRSLTFTPYAAGKQICADGEEEEGIALDALVLLLFIHAWSGYKQYRWWGMYSKKRRGVGIIKSSVIRPRTETR